jgi:hypothetical protein
MLRAYSPGMIRESHCYLVLSVRYKDKVHNLVCLGYTTLFMLKVLGYTKSVEICTHDCPNSLIYFIPLWYRYLVFKLL